MKNIKNKFVDGDGKVNGKMVAASISLLIMLGQQVFAAFGIKFTGDLNAIVAAINTLLLFLGFIGILSEPSEVSMKLSDVENDLTLATQLTHSKANLALKKATAAERDISDTQKQLTALTSVVTTK